MLPEQIHPVSTQAPNSNLNAPKNWGCTGNDDQLGLPGAERLEGRLVSEHIFTRFHNKRKARVDGIGGLLGLLGRGCFS